MTKTPECFSLFIRTRYENVLFNNTTATVSENTIISGAWEKAKKITISTLLFGRGTDIIPDDSTVLSVIIYEVFGVKEPKSKFRADRRARKK